jgi:hypothetical protein
MDERTKTALLGSIAKWEAIVDGTGKDYGASNCALCTEFGKLCIRCPVANHSGTSHCVNTPYTVWYHDRTQVNAQAELDFLKSLLPVEEKGVKKMEGTDEYWKERKAYQERVKAWLATEEGRPYRERIEHALTLEEPYLSVATSGAWDIAEVEFDCRYPEQQMKYPQEAE